ncbi:low affinity iron permease family protein [Acidisphaera sp. L21]|jgi:low affinity Fe/Cu permease|uniref:low affinity iron permease family protein n=1 Tax=Acidisphaera sp. L21 TaxID=1641851 RepID=UPI00131EA33F|nr:low affinity iron permease family protein [Acidisphaera sp. L21]
MEQLFSKLAQWTGGQLGKPHTFAGACLIVIIWAVTGPMFGYSDTWQLVINTGTTIITFLMVFLLQHTQNRDTRIIQLKLDELIRSNDNARDALLGLEELTDDDIRRIQAKFAALAKMGNVPDELVGAHEELQKVSNVLHRVRGRVRSVLKPRSPEQQE